MKIGYLMQAGVPNIRQQPPSGPANHVIQVFRELEEKGNTLILLAFQDGRLWHSTDLEKYEPVEIPVLDRGTLRLFERVIRRIQSTLNLPYAALFDSLRFALSCTKLFAGYDLLYERMGWFGYGGALASKLLKIPLVLEVNGDHISELEMMGYKTRGPQMWVSSKLMAFAIHQASMVVATGKGWQKRFIDRWGADPERVVIVENGTDVVQFLNRNELRSFHHDEDQPQITIIYVGAFEPWHGIPVLINAFHDLICRGVPAKLVLVGTGSEQEKITELVQERRLNGSVLFTGPLNSHEMAVQLSQADIGVSPYCGRVEFSGLKLLDYKAAGLATVASGMDGEPAVIDHGRTGWVVPPCDVDALCEALYMFAHNAPLRKKIGRAARLEAEELHSWGHTADNLENIFSQLVHRSENRKDS